MYTIPKQIEASKQVKEYIHKLKNIHLVLFRQ